MSRCHSAHSLGWHHTKMLPDSPTRPHRAARVHCMPTTTRGSGERARQSRSAAAPRRRRWSGARDAALPRLERLEDGEDPRVLFPPGPHPRREGSTPAARRRHRGEPLQAQHAPLLLVAPAHTSTAAAVARGTASANVSERRRAAAFRSAAVPFVYPHRARWGKIGRPAGGNGRVGGPSSRGAHVGGAAGVGAAVGLGGGSETVTHSDLTRSSTTLAWPAQHAMSSAVAPWSSCALASAPKASSLATKRDLQPATARSQVARRR